MRYRIFSHFILMTLFSFLFSCKEKNIDLVPNYDEEYLPSNQLSEQPKILSGSEYLKNKEFKEALEKIRMNDTIEFPSSLKYRVFVNERGEAEKLQSLNPAKFSVIDELLADEMSSWKFSVITKESKKIKYQFYWQFYLNEKQTTMKTDEIYELTVDEYPTPEGGMISLIKNIHYPETAKRAGLEGKVLVKVFINKNGDVSNAEIIKSDHSIFDSSAINALLKTKFTPARLKGQPVNVQITIPINFKLQ